MNNKIKKLTESFKKSFKSKNEEKLKRIKKIINKLEELDEKIQAFELMKKL